jgi:predicted RND superfamily exporter protein
VQFPGLEVGVTGPDALQADEMQSSMNSITLATWLSLLGQFGLLVVFFRGLRRPLVEVAILIIAVCWTFGLATLIVGHLNILSVIFAPLILGLGIDYGVHWLCRLDEEDAAYEQTSTIMALNGGVFRSLPGIIYAGLAAVFCFLPLAFMNFKGLAELGLILAIGIFIMLIATILLAPPLVLASERYVGTALPERCPVECSPYLNLKWKHPKWIMSVGLVIIGLGILSLFRVQFDLNPLHLQNPRIESVVWEMRILKESQYSTSFAAMTAGSLHDLEEKTAALKKLKTVSHVESVLSFLPAHQQEKRLILKDLEPLATSAKWPGVAMPSDPKDLANILSRINFKIDEAGKELEKQKAANKENLLETHRLINQILPLLDSQNLVIINRLDDFERHLFADLHDKWGLFQGYLKSALTSADMTPENLPQTVRVRNMNNGIYLIKAFPAQDIWDTAPLGQFVKSIQTVAPQAVGDPVLLYFITSDFRNAILLASGIGVLAIAAMLLFFYRSFVMTILALVPLWVGTCLTLFLMLLLGLSFNQANVLFLPLILGEGIEFGIIILTRWQLEGSAKAITLPVSTAKGVALASLTTTVGFGSLMISSHQGTFSLGLLATVGSLCVLWASLRLLPALLQILEPKIKPSPTLFHALLVSPSLPQTGEERR